MFNNIVYEIHTNNLDSFSNPSSKTLNTLPLFLPQNTHQFFRRRSWQCRNDYSYRNWCVVIVSINPKKLQGELLDLQHATTFFQYSTKAASTNYVVIAGLDLCIVTSNA